MSHVLSRLFPERLITEPDAVRQGVTMPGVLTPGVMTRYPASAVRAISKTDRVLEMAHLFTC